MSKQEPTLPLAIQEGIEQLDGGSTMGVNLWYPRSPGQVTHIQVGLYDVRAADDIRINYDFDRDGWVIEQAWIEVVEVPPGQEHPTGYGEHVDRWEEVAFVKAWKLNAEKGMAGPGTGDR